jgi:hypothetical protein
MDTRVVHPMADDSVRDQIAGLEQEIEALAESAERCRKVALAAKAAIVIGAAWLAALILGLIRPDAASLLGATAVILGGIVVTGSNATTARQTEAAIAQAEAQRTALIDALDPKLAPDAAQLLH